MSYSDDREQTPDPSGTRSGRNTGYSEEYPAPPPQHPPAAHHSESAQPSVDAQPPVKHPVELRPPEGPPPQPPDSPSPPSSSPPDHESIIEDEEFLAHDAGEAPEASGFDVLPTDSGPAPAATPAPADPASPAPASNPAPVRSEPADRDFSADESLQSRRTGDMLLDTRGLVKIYDGRTVVDGVDINVQSGEIVGLLGPNGAGKTTSFYMMVGLVPPNGGQVIFDGNDVTHTPMYQRARLGMGYLPQEESIFRKLTVEENIMAVMETLDLPRDEKVRRCNELLERFSITHIRKNIALTCSGGEKRRLTIARSLVTEPSLLMLDEPFSGVDPIAVGEIQTIVEDLRRSGLAILITDHNARQTLELVDRAYLIYEGRVLREGTRDFLINDPVSRELYLGERFTM